MPGSCLKVNSENWVREYSLGLVDYGTKANSKALRTPVVQTETQAVSSFPGSLLDSACPWMFTAEFKNNVGLKLNGAVVRKVEKGEKGISFIYFCFFGSSESASYYTLPDFLEVDHC